jgi:3-hydroxyacyl-[acyl-carrier-protein] dehydratase
MRWYWIDRFQEFESGRRAVAVKNVTLAEDHLHDHCPAYPHMPMPLMIEGMAQTAGILVGEVNDFAEKVILAKIRRARVEGLVLPGDQLRYEATIESMDEIGAATAGVVYCNGRRVGEIDLFFSHIDRNLGGVDFPEENFVFSDQFRVLMDTFAIDRAAGKVAEVSARE